MKKNTTYHEGILRKFVMTSGGKFSAFVLVLVYNQRSFDFLVQLSVSKPVCFDSGSETNRVFFIQSPRFPARTLLSDLVSKATQSCPRIVFLSDP